MNRDDILEKSFMIIDQEGLDQFSMRKLAEILEIKPASIYHYYKNKNDILSELFLRIFNKFLVSEKKSYDSVEDYLYDHCKLVQNNRREYIFLLKYRKAGFLSKEIIAGMKAAKEKNFARLKEEFVDVEFSLVLHLLINGPITELAFYEKNNKKNYKLSDEELKELVKRMSIAIRSDV